MAVLIADEQTSGLEELVGCLQSLTGVARDSPFFSGPPGRVEENPTQTVSWPSGLFDSRSAEEEKINIEMVGEGEAVENTINPIRPILWDTIKVDVELSTVLGRWSEIYNFTVTSTAGTGSTDFDALSLWYAKPYISAKLSDHAWFRGDLELMFQVSGTPLACGMLIAAVQPYSNPIGNGAGGDPHDNIYSNMVDFTPSGGSSSAAEMYMSMLPNVLLDVNSSVAPTLLVPYKNTHPWISLVGATPLNSWSRVFIRTLGSGIKTMTANATSVTVNVFARCVNYEVGGYTFQSEPGPQGLVSSALKKAKKFTGNKYVRSAGALVLQKMAGLSKPHDSSANMPMAPRGGSLATCDDVDTSYCLSVDSNCAVASSAERFGGEEDNLMVADICAKSCYLNTFSWSSAGTPGTAMMNYRVKPTLCNFGTPANVNRTIVGYTGNMVAHTPASHVSQMFGYWRGAAVFKFIVAGGSMLTGSLRVTYDPAYTSDSTIAAGVWTDTYAQTFSVVLDASREREVEVIVPWTQGPDWLAVERLRYSSTVQYQSARYNTVDASANGVLSVEFLNPLKGPLLAANAVDVHCFISFRDMEFAAPAAYYEEQFGMFQSLIINTEVDVCQNDGACEEKILGVSRFVDTTKLYFGEKVVSLRELMKRFCYLINDAQTAAAGGGANITRAMYANRMRFPPDFGYISAGVTNRPLHGTANATYNGANYVSVPAINYIKLAYLFMRGSVRYKFVLKSEDMTQAAELAVARLDPLYAVTVPPGLLNSVTDDSLLSSASANARNSMLNNYVTLSGGAFTSASLNNELEVQMPDYNDRLGVECRQLRARGPETADMFSMVARVQAGSVTGTRVQIRQFVAAGDDFSFHFYLTAPVMYFKGVNGPLNTT